MTKILNIERQTTDQLTEGVDERELDLEPPPPKF